MKKNQNSKFLFNLERKEEKKQSTILYYYYYYAFDIIDIYY